MKINKIIGLACALGVLGSFAGNAECISSGATFDLAAGKLYKAPAAQEHAAAQTDLGKRYLYGKGIDKDEKLATELFQEAADQGFAPAQYYLGICYQAGMAVDKDKKCAADLFQKAADQLHAGAQLYLGICYQEGIGVDKDEKRAFEWYSKAAAAGNFLAEYSLAICYLEGIGVAINEEQAIECFTRFFGFDRPMATLTAGRYYFNRKQEFAKALALYHKAADQGCAEAQVEIGQCYENGYCGLPKDLDQAITWYKKAAEQGDGEGISRLAHIILRNK